MDNTNELVGQLRQADSRLDQALARGVDHEIKRALEEQWELERAVIRSIVKYARCAAGFKLRGKLYRRLDTPFIAMALTPIFTDRGLKVPPGRATQLAALFISIASEDARD